jgi:hypothetical protein
MLAVFGNWLSDPTLGGKLSSSNSLQASLWVENPTYTLIKTGACVPSAADFNSDCKVNMIDFAEFANYWLNR